jgi:hypothetical protein
MSGIENVTLTTAPVLGLGPLRTVNVTVFQAPARFGATRRASDVRE